MSAWLAAVFARRALFAACRFDVFVAACHCWLSSVWLIPYESGVATYRH